MKSTAYAVLMIMLAVAMVQTGKSKRPKFCLGKNNIKYKQNEGYTEGCTQFICVKKGKKLKMVSKQVPKCEDGAWSAWSSYSACSATCGPATKARTRTCSNPAPANGGKPCPGLNQQTMDCQLSPCRESEPDLAANVTAIEASMQFLNESMESIERKVEALQSSVESILEMMTAVQTTSKNFETNIASNMEAINTNKKSITTNEGSISVNKETISTNNDALAAKDTQMEMNITLNIDAINTNKKSISTNNATLAAKDAQMEMNITSNMNAINSNKVSIIANEDAISVNKDTISTNNDTLAAKDTQMESCLADISSSECPSPASGKTSVAGGISANTAALDDKCDASICSDIQEAIAELQQPKFNLVISGGDSPSTEKHSEVISSENVCSQSIPPLVYGFQQLSTSVFFNNSIWICGGGGSGGKKKKCQILKAGASQWTLGPDLKVKRHLHTIVKAGDELIAMGAWVNNHGSSSMEKFSLASGEWTLMSETMPRGRFGHCSVYFPTTKSVVVTGGGPFTKQTDSFDVVSGQWTQLDPLPKELRGHGCITMGQSILVAGGYANGERYQKNVYSLNMINGKTWQTFGELTVPRAYFAMGFVDNKLVIAGGDNDDKGSLATIDTREENGVWRESKLRLSVPRNYFAATMVPAEAFPCQRL